MDLPHFSRTHQFARGDLKAPSRLSCSALVEILPFTPPEKNSPAETKERLNRSYSPGFFEQPTKEAAW
jgi:hypothetical protein